MQDFTWGGGVALNGIQARLGEKIKIDFYYVTFKWLFVVDG